MHLISGKFGVFAVRFDSDTQYVQCQKYWQFRLCSGIISDKRHKNNNNARKM